MPSIWEFEVAGVQPENVRPPGVHAVISKWLGESPAQHLALKGYSQRGCRPIANGCQIQLGAISPEVEQVLPRIDEDCPITFGHRIGAITKKPRCLISRSWDELMVGSPLKWEIRFTSPVSIRRDGICQPWPSPHAILRSLATSWSSFATRFGTNLPLPLPYHPDWANYVLVTRTHLDSRLYLDIAPTPVAAATGRVTWRWDGSGAGHHLGPTALEAAKSVSALLHLATFTGMGAYNQFGFGQVQINRQWSALEVR